MPGSSGFPKWHLATLINNVICLKICVLSFIYLKGRATEGENKKRQTEKKRQKSILWFALQVPTAVKPGPSQVKRPELHLCLPCGWLRPKNSGSYLLFSWMHEQEAGSKAEVSRLILVLRKDTGIPSGSLAC